MRDKSKIQNPKSKINPNIKYQNFKNLFCNLSFVIGISFVICHLSFVIFSENSFAQHEGHQPEGNGLASSSQSHEMPDAKKETAPAKARVAKPIYYCPMHPTYTSDKPGDCPICNMKLVKKPVPRSFSEGGEDLCVIHNCPMTKCQMKITGNIEDCAFCKAQLVKTEANAEDSGPSIYISAQKQQLIGVKTEKAGFKQLAKTIRTVGRVAFDPELYKAQQEYIEAVKTYQKVKDSEQKEIIERCKAMIAAAQLKLELSGLSNEQIAQLAQNLENDQSLLISSSESAITWVYATVYEYELDYVKARQEAVIRAEAYPDKEFLGKIIAIDPVFNEMTRSVRARLQVDNKDGLLKPNMYVDVLMHFDLGPRLVVSKDAVMDSGLRKVVFISLPDGYFKPQEVKTGVLSDEYIEVVEGIKEGDEVVVSGNFLIDSESKLKSALEGIGHQH